MNKPHSVGFFEFGDEFGGFWWEGYGGVDGGVVDGAGEAPVAAEGPYREAYSWGVGEDESRDGLYCGFEGVVGAAVIAWCQVVEATSRRS